MKLTREILAGVCCWLLVLAGLSFAGTSWADEPLTGDVIERWLSSQKELSAWGEQNSHRLELQDGEGYPSTAADMLAPVREAGLYSEVQNLVSKYGFASPEQWADASVRIIGAVASIEIDKAMEDADIQQQINEIQTAEGMSAAQKQQMIQMMQQSLSAVQQMANASAADIAAVQPHLSKIAAVLEAE